MEKFSSVKGIAATMLNKSGNEIMVYSKKVRLKVPNATYNFYLNLFLNVSVIFRHRAIL